MSDLRISGLISGFDTDSMVKDLLKAQSSKVDNVKKDKQIVEWQQEMYREIIDKMRSFQSNFFDVLKPSSNLRSTSSFSKFSYSTTINGTSSSKVSVTASSTASSYNHSIEYVTQLATKDTWSGDQSNLKGILTDGFDLSTLKSDIGAEDFKFIFNVDGTSKTISISNMDINNMSSIDDLVSRLNTEISASFGSEFSSIASKVNISGNDEIKFYMPSNTLKVYEYEGSETSLSGMKLTNGEGSSDYMTKPISELFDLSGIDLSSLSINSQNSFGIEETDTISEMMSKINSSGAGVKLSFDYLNDKFSLESNEEGVANNLTMDDLNTQNMFSLLGITDGVNHVSAKNAVLSLDGVEIVQSSNKFEIEGITYNVKETLDVADGPIDINVTKDVDSILDNIVKFVDEYNNLIDHINGLLNEKKNYSYKPLTDEEKKALSEDEVKLWEDKAKKGILRNSTDLSNITTLMRTALYESVEGVGITLDSIGITTTSNYKDNGKLTIDEDKLRSALDDNFDDVVKLFTSESDKEYLDSNNSTERYNENGISFRIYDILRDNVRTTRNDNGSKGTLIEKAGLVGDLSQYSNILSSLLDNYDSRIDDLLDDLAVSEKKYYQQFASMEKAMSELQNQSTWLTQQLGG